ncbi:MAG: hypothetical protein JNM81_14820, partial [Rhodospirillaceae bacterium]|nr:hypothetical protein [Rhodospirillaceae bacterium]
SSLAEYEMWAVRFAQQPEIAQNLKKYLVATRGRSLLYGSTGFVADLEKAYTQAVQLYRSGQPTAHMHLTKGEA